MSIIRAPRPDTGWTLTGNAVARDERISDKARGLLVRMLSHADHYEFSSERLAYDKAGRDAVRAALKELEEAGYCRRETSRDARGRITTHTYVYDTPSSTGLPTPENPTPDKPTPENPASKERPSKERPSKERPSKDQNRADVAAPENPSRTQVANAIAKTIYDEANGMHDFQKLRGVAQKAVDAGFSAERVVDAMRRADSDGRPLTAQVVRQYLTGATAKTKTEQRREQNDRVTEFALALTDQKNRKALES